MQKLIKPQPLKFNTMKKLLLNAELSHRAACKLYRLVLISTAASFVVALVLYLL
ncbi:hypothetical protein Phi47:1_gp72 [Cellulophaga phage phi47:1]|nr:hypothetical protein Phi3ST:2_gp72 [Cellulophaga phage phi3ST:2]AGO48268.1 hypothetical protein PhiSM_gp73 [Cellulophaga phage phiSM]AGO49311.1 hypothetical protein Phi38:2_gp72 [Cellulophaga phage phi38:2]AGO49392.1 hypothetical protein Phi3:1_gp73 [Cellulophaga phage phi3:1]AGO49809.1 hypothetical protein Phi47:1_gp72 [Cellulophaga phage phi47:1]